MADKDMVGIVEIAERLGLDPTNVRRLIAKEAGALDLRLHRGKGERLLLPKEDAEKLVASYKARRGPVTDYQLSHSPVTANGSEDEATYDRYGFFYLIQLVPEALPNRVKIGFSDDPEQRLNQHRTAAPTARLLKTWPCKRSWDYAAMDSITREDCKLVLNEVYEGDVNGFLERGNTFFSLMPDPDAEKDLSEYSPLYESAKRGEANGKIETGAAGSEAARDANQ
jgi:hypothetical protein